MTRANKRSGCKDQFPVRLHDMMTFVDTECLESVVGWVLGGRGFMIHDSDKLVEIVSLFFGLTKYKSFVRQLNMWDFERISHGPNKGTYMHPYFAQGNRDLCLHMSRQIKKKGPSRAPAPMRREQQAIFSNTELGSFKYEISDCGFRLSKDLDPRKQSTTTTPTPIKSSISSAHATNSAVEESSSKSSSRTKQQEIYHTITAGKTTKQERTSDFFCKSYSTFSSWGAILDLASLEPSPIAPRLAAFSSNNGLPTTVGEILEDYSYLFEMEKEEEEESATKEKTMNNSSDSKETRVLEDETILLDESVFPIGDKEGASGLLLGEDDLSFFAGKRFFLVDEDHIISRIVSSS
jgi:hypothetical protein